MKNNQGIREGERSGAGRGYSLGRGLGQSGEPNPSRVAGAQKRLEDIAAWRGPHPEGTSEPRRGLSRVT